MASPELLFMHLLRLCLGVPRAWRHGLRCALCPLWAGRCELWHRVFQECPQGSTPHPASEVCAPPSAGLGDGPPASPYSGQIVAPQPGTLRVFSPGAKVFADPSVRHILGKLDHDQVRGVR